MATGQHVTMFYMLARGGHCGPHTGTVHLRPRGVVPFLRTGTHTYPHTITCSTITAWWLDARARVQSKTRRTFDTAVIAIAWSLWKQRNARVFGRVHEQRGTVDLVAQIRDELSDWNMAGVDRLQIFARE